MFYFIVLVFFIVSRNDVCVVAGWDPANFTFNPGENYELVWQDEFENVGPVQAIINGQPAYASNPKNWAHVLGTRQDDGLENYTDSIYNSYVQNGQLNIVAMKENYTSAKLSSRNLQEFTFGIFAAKILLPYGRGIWPAWWLVGNAQKYNLSAPTNGEIDILEMWGGDNKTTVFTDQIAHATVHWNNQSNTMNPKYNKFVGTTWETPDGSKLHDNSLVYWTEWTPRSLAIGVNEFTYLQLNTSNMPDSINPVIAYSGLWPYAMRLDVAVASGASGPPDNTTVWPQKMVVDWARVYQKMKI